MSGVPTFDHEINRKTLATVKALLSEVRGGVISVPEFQAAMRAVWGVTAGIIANDILELVVELVEQDREWSREVRLYVDDKDVPLSVELERSTNEVHVRKGLKNGMWLEHKRIEAKGESNPAHKASLTFDMVTKKCDGAYRRLL